MLSGNNGILNRAGEAKDITNEKQIEERVQLAYLAALTEGNGQATEGLLVDELDKEFGQNKYELSEDLTKVIIDEKEYEIGGTVVGENDEIDIKDLWPTDNSTMPYLPSDSFHVSEVSTEQTINGGLVITDGINEFVWVEVPKSIYTDSNYTTDLTENSQGKKEVTSATDYDGIYKVLNKYAYTYREGSEGQGYYWQDEWYDRYNATVIGIKNGERYAQVKNVKSSNFTSVKSYYGTLYTNIELTETVGDSYDSSKQYYAIMTEELLGDITGCGLTYTQYVTQYQRMLKSVYTNGGFWIGRYEAGVTSRTSRVEPALSPIPLSQVDLEPYTYVYCSDAQILAERVATEDENNENSEIYTSSLMFGIQWDLVCKFLEGSSEWDTSVQTAIQYINTNSSSWGNYKPNSGSGSRKSTGSSSTYRKRNIYDFAGNVWEWTLEHATSSSGNPCSERGGCYSNTGSGAPASYRAQTNTTRSDIYNRFSCSTLLVDLSTDSDKF